MTQHILIIDDSYAEARMLTSLLEKEGYQVTHASNGREGVEVAKTTQPNLVLMDVVMPFMNGFQATRELAKTEETSHIPVVVCSSKAADTDFLWAKRQGAKGYLVKPIMANDLLRVLKQFLPEAQANGQPV